MLNDNFAVNDVKENKTIAGLSYIIFFLPLLICPDSEFAKFHANQSLVLWIAGVVGNVGLRLIPIVGWFIAQLFNLAILIFLILGLVNGLNGEAKELPIVGQYKLLK